MRCVGRMAAHLTHLDYDMCTCHSHYVRGRHAPLRDGPRTTTTLLSLGDGVGAPAPARLKARPYGMHQ